MRRMGALRRETGGTVAAGTSGETEEEDGAEGVGA